MEPEHAMTEHTLKPSDGSVPAIAPALAAVNDSTSSNTSLRLMNASKVRGVLTN